MCKRLRITHKLNKEGLYIKCVSDSPAFTHSKNPKNKIQFFLFQVGHFFVRIATYSECLRNRRQENNSEWFQLGDLPKYKRR